MKILLELPDDFKVHYDFDKFKDSLGRVSFDLKEHEVLMSGNYEQELMDALYKAFPSSKEMKDG